jgi:hypothetical protein
MQALVDRLAEIRAEIRALSEEESAIKAQLLGLQQNIVEGERYTAILKLVPQTRLDSDAVKSEMGMPWYRAHCKTVESIRIETVAKAA